MIILLNKKQVEHLCGVIPLEELQELPDKQAELNQPLYQSPDFLLMGGSPHRCQPNAVE
jgi:hypothetical protein